MTRPTPYWALILLALSLAAWLVIVGGLKAAWANGRCENGYWYDDIGGFSGLPCTSLILSGNSWVGGFTTTAPPTTFAPLDKQVHFTCPSGTTRVLDEQYRPKCAKGLSDGEWK